MIKPLARGVLKKLDLYGLYSLSIKGPIREDGWFRSFRERRSIDARGNPVPYVTYPAIDFLTRRVRPEWSVFEYGSGASTLWWAARVSEVVACEHDRGWHQNVSRDAPPNAKVHHVPLEYDGEYCRHILQYAGRFDVVVIDGRDRVRCATNAISALNERGVLIWDNTERPSYSSGITTLLDHGFRRIEFVGMAPIDNQKSETSIFYREGNCLGI